MAKVNPVEGIDSQSFYPLLSNASTGQRQYNYTEVLSDRAHRSGHTISNEKYKLIVLDNGNQEYYDLLNDPGETTNLLDASLSSEASSVLNEFHQELSTIRN